MAATLKPWTESHLRRLLPAESFAATRPSYGAADGRPYDDPDNFSVPFRSLQPAVAWLSDSFNEVNTQVTQLNLKGRFSLLQETGAVTPAALRQSYRGPLLFTITECDSAVHWECVEHVAAKCCHFDDGGPVLVHCLQGRLRHAPNIEDPDQYNRVLLAFFRGESLPGASQAQHG